MESKEITITYSREFVIRASMKGVSNECHAADQMVEFLKSKGYSDIKNLHVMVATPDGRKDRYIVSAK